MRISISCVPEKTKNINPRLGRLLLALGEDLQPHEKLDHEDKEAGSVSWDISAVGTHLGQSAHRIHH